MDGDHLLNQFERELASLDSVPDQLVREKLEYLVGAPMTYRGYRLAYYGMFSLMRQCGATKQDERFREAVYRKVTKMLEEEPDPTDSMAATHQTDYATSLLSHFMSPPVPKEPASRLRAAAQKFYERVGKEDAFLKRFMDSDLLEK